MHEPAMSQQVVVPQSVRDPTEEPVASAEKKIEVAVGECVVVKSCPNMTLLPSQKQCMRKKNESKKFRPWDRKRDKRAVGAAACIERLLSLIF
jgi:hypothetical protein